MVHWTKYLKCTTETVYNDMVLLKVGQSVWSISVTQKHIIEI